MLKKSDFRPLRPEAILQDRIGPGATKVSFPIYQENSAGELELAPLSTPGAILQWRKEHPGALLFVPIHVFNDDVAPLPPPAQEEGERRFAEKSKAYSEIPPPERHARFVDVQKGLSSALREKDAATRNETVWNAGEETFLLMKGALDGLEDPAQADFMEENKLVVDEIVGQLVTHISDKMETRKLFSRLGDFSDGCTLAHINRVFLQTMKFLHYYNFNLARGLEAAVERLFEPGQRYHHHYRKTFRCVFREGLKPWNKARLTQGGIAGLLHDVGKIPNLSYFESDEAYDRSAIEAHALQGYELLIAMGGWASEAAFVAGTHHEYGGHPSGYGIRRSRPELAVAAVTPCLVSTDLGVVVGNGARDYFLTEVVQIVDIYDALRCNNRKYRKDAFSEAGTLSMMREMTRVDRKLNLVLFDLFIGFTAADLTGDNLKTAFDASKLLVTG